ncbi:MAG: hypothetical protein AAGE98_17835 [Actinomycetota bacterium]
MTRMRDVRRSLRLAGFGLAAVLGAFIVLADDDGVQTNVGTAGVAVGGDTARAVERVVYRQDVVRLGDVIVIDGEAANEIRDPDVEAMWEIVRSTWPASLDGELRQLSVIEEGERGLVGVVHPATNGGWILSLDAADLGDRRLLEETIVHELSHVVTLDREVFAFGDGDCDGTRIELGCASAGTVLAEFAAVFWPDGDPGERSGDFVNDYAASAAHEDLSETFTSMVMGWTPAGDVIDAKVALIEADPELAALADELRTILFS